MPLFGKGDEAEEHFKQAKRYANPKKKEFDPRRAIEEFKAAITLKPDEPKYHDALGEIYLNIPLLAVVRGGNVSFRLNELAHLALREFKQAASLSKKYSTSPVNAYVFLGKWEKAIECAELAGDLKRVKELQKLMATERKEPRVDTFEAEFAKTAARGHIEQAVMYRNLGEFEKADRELSLALKVAPPIDWFNETLCELGS